MIVLYTLLAKCPVSHESRPLLFGGDRLIAINMQCLVAVKSQASQLSDGTPTSQLLEYSMTGRPLPALLGTLYSYRIDTNSY